MNQMYLSCRRHRKMLKGDRRQKFAGDITYERGLKLSIGRKETVDDKLMKKVQFLLATTLIPN